MKKQAIWTAVLGLMLAGQARADIQVFTNQTTHLDIYARFHLGLEAYSVKGLKPTSDADGTRLQSHSSRLGFRGDQGITDDLKVVGQAEAGLSALGNDDGSTPFFTTRNTYLGLNSAVAGEVRVGRHDVAYKMLTARDNLFADTIGENDAIISEGGGRADDTLIYLSPKWKDLQFIGSVSLTDMQEYSSDKLTTNTARSLEAGQSLSGGLQYDAGAHGFIAVAFESQEADRLTSTNSASGYDSAVLSLGAPKLGGFQIVGALEFRSGNGKPDETNYSLGFAQDLGDKWVVKGNYGWKDVDAAEANANMITAGFSYKATKTLELYLLYTAIDNESKSKIDFADGPIGKTTSSSSGLTAGDDVSAVALGAVYCF